MNLQNEIEMFFHCKECLIEVGKLNNMSPREYAELEVGWTTKGFQVWCKRHEKNVVHLDFKGQKVGYAYEKAS